LRVVRLFHRPDACALGEILDVDVADLGDPEPVEGE
jgi:hypothetical protein